MRALYVAALLLVVARVVVGSISGIGIYADSVRYWKPSDPTTVFGLDGGRGPGFLIQTIYLLPSGIALLLQLTVIGLGWGLVSLIAAGLARRDWLRWVSFAAVAVWSFMPFVRVWDTALMTEGLATASVVAVIGCLFFLPASSLPQPVVRWSYAMAVIWAFVALATRPQLVVFVLPVFIGHAVLFVFLRERSAIADPRGWAVVAILGMCTLAIILTLLSSDRYEGWYAQNRLAFRADDHYLALAREAGMPECDALAAALGDARAVRALDCPELQAWFEAGGLSPQRELVMAPLETLASYRLDFPRQWSVVMLTREDGGPSLMDARTSDANFMNALLRWVTLISTAAAAITAVVHFALLRSRHSAQPIAIAVILGFSGLAYLYTSWAQDGMEITRHAIPISLVTAPTAWMIILLSARGRFQP